MWFYSRLICTAYFLDWTDCTRVALDGEEVHWVTAEAAKSNNARRRISSNRFRDVSVYVIDAIQLRALALPNNIIVPSRRETSPGWSVDLAVGRDGTLASHRQSPPAIDATIYPPIHREREKGKAAAAELELEAAPSPGVQRY